MFLEVNSWDRRRNTKKLVRQIALFKSCQADLGGRRETEVGSNERTNERTEGRGFGVSGLVFNSIFSPPFPPWLSSPSLSRFSKSLRKKICPENPVWYEKKCGFRSYGSLIRNLFKLNLNEMHIFLICPRLSLLLITFK